MSTCPSRKLLAKQQVALDGIIAATVNKATSCRTEDIMTLAQQLEQKIEYNKALDIAKNLLLKGMSIELVKKVTKLPDLDLAKLEKA